MRVRQAPVMPARIGSQLAYIVIIIIGLAWLGVLLFGGILLQLVYFITRIRGEEHS